MFHHAIRITLPYEDCSGIISQWADRSLSAIVYQHNADEEISKTHVHIGLWGCEVKAEALKRMWSDAPGKGNEFWSWKVADEPDTPGQQKYLSYMTKGILFAVFVKNFSNLQMETSRQLWVEPVLGNDKAKDSSEYYIEQVLKKYDKFMSLQQFTEHIAMDEGSCSWDFERVLHDIRSTTMRMFYSETRRVPHATLYKTVAGTAFLRLCDRWNYLDSGIKELKNLWY